MTTDALFRILLARWLGPESAYGDLASASVNASIHTDSMWRDLGDLYPPRKPR